MQRTTSEKVAEPTSTAGQKAESAAIGPDWKIVEQRVTEYSSKFYGQWPEMLWEETETETVVLPEASPTQRRRMTATLVREGMIFVLAGSPSGWIIHNAWRLYEPDSPPLLWDYLKEKTRAGPFEPFGKHVNELMRLWLRYLDGGQITFDRATPCEDGVEIEWHIDLASLPEHEAIDMLPYRRGRWVLDPANAYLPIRGETTGELYFGGTARLNFAAQHRRYHGLPMMTHYTMSLFLADDEAQSVTEFQGALTVKSVSTTLDRSKLTLAYFGLPNSVRLGPPEVGVPRWQRLLGAAVALLICGAILAWWLRRAKAA